ncbi:MAG: hypothetical protein ACTHNW_01420 [Mucilaginibacter sp.]
MASVLKLYYADDVINIMKGGKPVIRRTFSQERFEILIKKQKAGEATWRDLTELDEIVNRVPDIRLTILEEMEGKTLDEDFTEILPPPPHPTRPALSDKLKHFFNRLFRFNTVTLPVV